MRVIIAILILAVVFFLGVMHAFASDILARQVLPASVVEALEKKSGTPPQPNETLDKQMRGVDCVGDLFDG